MAEGKVITVNRKARHDYHILDTMEAGICLQGTEVKSLRRGMVNLKDSYASVENNEVFIENMHISPYDYGNIFNHEPLRKRKLLLHKSQIKQLIGKTKEKGLTLVPLKLYLKNGLVKVELALAKGKKLYDKRQDLAAKDAKREMERAFKERGR